MAEIPHPTPSPTLDTIPHEVLGHIAFLVATPELLGPPSDLASLCSTSRLIYASLSVSANPSLYGAVFRSKFDIAAPLRRLDPEYTTAQCLADEMRKRFETMKRIRDGTGSRANEVVHREEDLNRAIFMMLENDGKNAMQLKHFALVEEWLRRYMLEYVGGSFTEKDMSSHRWPRDSLDNKLALWLLWLCDAEGPGNSIESVAIRQTYCKVLRAYALGATKYPLTQHSWTDFSNGFSMEYQSTSGPTYLHFNRPIMPAAPPISVSAILGYISRIKQPNSSSHYPSPNVSSVGISLTLENVAHASQSDERQSTGASSSNQWECDWERCAGLFEMNLNGLQHFHRPGVLEGAWEGLFTYTEFSVYAGILSGGGPRILNDRAIGQNLQVWRLREYNLCSALPSDAQPEFIQSPAGPQQTGDPGRLPPGEALDAFFPPVIVKEKGDHVVFTHNSKETLYTRALQPIIGDAETSRTTLNDVVILGEGHSSWGDFKLRGRMRASDAFVTILKEYNGADDRGRWLYRGYVVGGRLVGRWRDAFSPLNMHGYEGSFELGRRI